MTGNELKVDLKISESLAPSKLKVNVLSSSIGGRLKMLEKSRELDADGCGGVGGRCESDSGGEREEEREEVEAAPLAIIEADDEGAPEGKAVPKSSSMLRMSSRPYGGGSCCCGSSRAGAGMRGRRC